MGQTNADNVTYEEYAERNLRLMREKPPTAQNMRDVALLELWTGNRSPVAQEANTEQNSELWDVFPALRQYRDDHSINNLQKLCTEIVEFCNEIYASTRSKEEREIYHNSMAKIK